jgi:ABC-type transport system involved in multi-copper enzyme maturation permease subunit
VPIHDRAYLRMEDRAVRSSRPAFLAVSHYAIKYLRKTKLYWFFVILAMLPALIMTFLIYALAEGETFGPNLSLATFERFSPEEYRTLFADRAMAFLQIQAFALTFVAALAGGAAIAEDTRRHAFELYFSRPISAASYLAGKWFFVFTRLLIVLLAPTLFVLIIAFGFLPNCFSACWPMAFRITAAAMMMAASYAVVVLAVSASVRTTRYAVVFWFILAFVTIIAGIVLVQITRETRFEVVSFRFTIEHVASWILGGSLESLPNVELEDRSLALSTGVLAAWLAGAGLLLLRRLRADARG